MASCTAAAPAGAFANIKDVLPLRPPAAVTAMERTNRSRSEATLVDAYPTRATANEVTEWTVPASVP